MNYEFSERAPIILPEVSSNVRPPCVTFVRDIKEGSVDFPARGCGKQQCLAKTPSEPVADFFFILQLPASAETCIFQHLSAPHIWRRMDERHRAKGPVFTSGPSSWHILS